MERHSIVCTIVIILLHIILISAQSFSDVGNLMDGLFANYNKNIRPLNNMSTVIQLDIDFILLGINEVNEKDQKLVTNGYLVLSWKDECLIWEPSMYNGVQSFMVSQNEVWKPDIVLKNGFTKLSELGNNFILVSVQHDGEVSWAPSEVFESKCSINTRYFPFDEQSCELVFVMWMTKGNYIEFKLLSDQVTLEDIEKNGMWSIESTRASNQRISLDGESNVTYTINIRRNPGNYIANIIIPVFFLSILTIFTFVLPADSGEKMGYSLAVFLSFAVFLTIVSSELPKTKGSILGFYILFELGISSIIVCITALQLRFYNRKSDVPKAIVRIMKLKCYPCRRKNQLAPVKNVSDVKDDNIEVKDWSDVISMVDIALFWIMLILKVVVTTLLIIILTMSRASNRY